jgi:hypothetical protein
MFAAAAVFLAIGASGCGGDDEGLSAESAAAVEQFDEACDAWRSKLEALGRVPVKDFDPENPEPAELRTVGNHFVSGHPINEAAIAELENLAVPTELKADVDALIAALNREFEWQKAQAKAAQDGDVAAFKATLDDAASTNDAVTAAAEDLGAEECAF